MAIPYSNTSNDQAAAVRQIAILAGESQKSELSRSPVFHSQQVIFAESLEELVSLKADAYMDLMFEADLYEEFKRNAGFRKLNESGIFQPGSVRPVETGGIKPTPGNQDESETIPQIKPDEKSVFQPYSERQARRIQTLSRLLPLPVFINSVIRPVSAVHPDFIRINGWPGFLEMPLLEAAAQEDSAKKARRIFGDLILFVKDVPGFVNPRIISMIINEAFFTLGAGTSSRAEIDTAMKLGTNYPLGPFEWKEKIGGHRVAALLTALQEEDGLYGLAEQLIMEN